LKPGSVCWPFFGIVPDIVHEKGSPVKKGQTGKLIIKKPWPGMMKTIYGDQKRFVETYFKEFPGYYLTGDSAYCDKENDYWIIGRDDDVIKVAGHRLGTGELESILVSHPSVSEAAVVAVPDETKGSAIYAYVTLKTDVQATDTLKKELIQKVRDDIGPIATPSVIQWAEDLPKTRSGKIMRRILRKIACGEIDDLGDTSTLAEPSVVEKLIEEKKK
jgi:acetyl-CoA synthetase